MHDENSARGWLRSFGGFLAQVFRDAVRTLCGLGWRRWLVILLAVAAVAVAARYVDVPELTDLRAGAQQYGDFFVVLFALSYIVFTLFPLPRTIWTVAAGILFGPVLGLGLALVCLTVSAALAFLGVRTLFGEWMRPPGPPRMAGHLQPAPGGGRSLLLAQLHRRADKHPVLAIRDRDLGRLCPHDCHRRLLRRGPHERDLSLDPRRVPDCRSCRATGPLC